MDPIVLISVITIPVAAGAAFGGVRAGLNGMRESVRRIDHNVDQIVGKVADHTERLARVETRVDTHDRFFEEVAE